jgi:isoamylase
MVLDSLRHWVEHYHVDGFRFDLAPSLAREPYDFSHRAGFLRSVAQDPVLSQVKLIAEPWDLGEGGYRIGAFGPGWSEWNDQFRDTIRGFWRGDPGQLPALARVIAGSRETYEPSGRHPWASVNFVSAHDGFTLEDLVSYNDKHNEANGEENRDGHSHNLSWNCGIEGPTDDPEILALRARLKRNLLATVLLSQGVPMLLMGDELSRSQGGNNNAYAQDNETSWLDWAAGGSPDPDLLRFVKALTALRRRHDAFRRRAFLTGAPVDRSGLSDVYWLAPEGREMTAEDWHDGERRTMGVQLGNDAADGCRFLLLMNGSPDEVPFRLAAEFPSGSWVRLVDTAEARGRAPDRIRPGAAFDLAPRSFVLFGHEDWADRGG